MNDTGGGVTAIHDVPGDITRIGFHWMLLFFLSVTRRGLLLFVLHTECRGDHGFSLSRICELSNCFFTRNVAEITDFFVPNFRIFELFLHTESLFFFSHGWSRTVTDFLCPDFFPCPEFANLRIFSSHGMSRRSRIFFVPRLVLGPTDQREVIAEFLSITRSVADGCGACSSCEWGLFVVVYRPIRGVCV